MSKMKRNKCPPLNLWNYIAFWNWIVNFSQPLEEYKKEEKEINDVVKKQHTG